MVQQRYRLPLLIIVLLLITAGCGLLDRNSPEQVARAWLEAGLKQDMTTYMKLSCSADRDTIMESGFYMALLGSAANYFGFDIEVNADLSELEFKTVQRNKRSAIVSVNGTLFISVNKMPVEIPFDDVQLYLVREDNEWRVCSTLSPGN